MSQLSSAAFLRIGTRGSPLALWQAREVRSCLAAAHGVEPDAIAITPIRTTDLMLGKVLPYACIGFLDMLLTLGVMVSFFSISITGSFWFLCMASIIFILASLGMGLFFSTISQTQVQAIQLTVAIFLSAVVVTFYTMVGGMWSVAYTDAFQLALIPIGLLAALPFALAQVGGLDASLEHYFTAKPWAAYLIPPLTAADPHWTPPRICGWWDYSLMLLLGGIPWNCYFQRVLSCQTPAKAQWHSLIAGVLTISLTVPPLLLGIAAAVYAWPATQAAQLKETPTLALPLLLHDLTPPGVAILGLGAIIGAVTSSFSSSILSAGSMLSWNVYRRLLVPQAHVRQMRLVIRSSIVLLGAGATVMALHVQSVQELWFFTSDLIFVLLFPQLLMALFDGLVLQWLLEPDAVPSYDRLIAALIETVTSAVDAEPIRA